MNSPLNYRLAEARDLPAIVQMLADDELGKKREKPDLPLNEKYIKAFAEISQDAHNELIVVELGDEIVGTFQLTYIPSLSFQGSTRMQVESVRVAEAYRGQGLGSQFFEWIIERAKNKNCGMIQLSTNNARQDAHRFYEKLGFQATHLGMKLYLIDAH
jgi:GNAT superfamily N-acetyltransferase